MTSKQGIIKFCIFFSLSLHNLRYMGTGTLSRLYMKHCYHCLEIIYTACFVLLFVKMFTHIYMLFVLSCCLLLYVNLVLARIHLYKSV